MAILEDESDKEFNKKFFFKVQPLSRILPSGPL